MRFGVIGGLWFGGLVAWALMGLVPGCILIGIGAVIGWIAAAMDRQAEKQAESWRRKYPPYKY